MLPEQIAPQIKTDSKWPRTYFTYVTSAGRGADFLFVAGRQRPDTTDSYQFVRGKETTVPPSFRWGEVSREPIPVACIAGEGTDGIVVARLGDFALRLGEAVFSQGITANQLGAALLLAAYAPRPKIAEDLQETISPLISPAAIDQAFPELHDLNPPVIISPPTP